MAILMVSGFDLLGGGKFEELEIYTVIDKIDVYTNGLVVEDIEYLYLANNITIRKIRKKDMEVVNVSEQVPSQNQGVINAIASDNNYIYVGLSDSRVIKKYSKHDFSLIASSLGGSSLNHINGIDVDDNYLYVGGYASNTQNRTVYKIDKNTLENVARTERISGYVPDVLVSDGYVYATEVDNLHRFRKIDSSDMSVVASTSSIKRGGHIKVDSSEVYVIIDKVINVLDVSDLELLRTNTEYGSGRITSVVGDFLYSVGDNVIRKIDKNSFNVLNESERFAGELTFLIIDDDLIFTRVSDGDYSGTLKVSKYLYLPKE